jgi:hypothetical protein
MNRIKTAAGLSLLSLAIIAGGYLCRPFSKREAKLSQLDLALETAENLRALGRRSQDANLARLMAADSGTLFPVVGSLGEVCVNDKCYLWSSVVLKPSPEGTPRAWRAVSGPVVRENMKNELALLEEILGEDGPLDIRYCFAAEGRATTCGPWGGNRNPLDRALWRSENFFSSVWATVKKCLHS